MSSAPLQILLFGESVLRVWIKREEISGGAAFSSTFPPSLFFDPTLFSVQLQRWDPADS